MAYKYVVNKACVNRAAVVAEIHAQLVAMGWTYVDGEVNNPALSIPYTDVNVTDNTFTKVGHTLLDGTPVQVQTTTTIPPGLAINTLYYVVNVSGDTFKLAATYGGAAINITGQGVGSHSVVEAFRIFSSDGEGSDQIAQYQIISSLATNAIYPRACYKYDIATRTYSVTAGTSYGYYILTTSEIGCYVWIHGNKNLVHIATKSVSTYYRGFLGFIKPFFTLTTALTSAATLSVNPVTLAVTSSVGFEVGNSYQIVGVLGEGRENVTITAIGTGTITISALLESYGIGARIGINPCLFGAFFGPGMGLTCPHNVVGLNTANVYTTIINALSLTCLDPDYKLQKYVLQPIIFDNSLDAASANASIGGYIDENILVSPYVGMVIEDTFAVGKLDSGTSSGTNNTTSVFYDTAKSWTIDAYIGKVVIITFGLGSGMIKKIISNTATTLTIHADYLFETIPDNTSQYIICDEGYRYLDSGTGSGAPNPLAIREGI